MTISSLFLKKIRHDANSRLPNTVEIFKRIEVNDGHGSTKYEFVKKSGPHRANFQIRQRFPFVDNVASQPKTSTEYAVRIPIGVEVEITDIIQFENGNRYEVTEVVNEHSLRFVNLIYCKKIQ